MKKIIMLGIIMGLIILPFLAQAQENNEANQLGIRIIQLQAQGQMLASDFQSYVDRYVDRKREIQNQIEQLRVQIATLQKAEPKGE